MRPRRELFPSVVLTVRDAAPYFATYLQNLSSLLAENFDFYEILVVDDASEDGTTAIVETAQKTLPNITLFCLPRAYDFSIATVTGLDHAIGDVVITLDPRLDQSDIVLDLVDEASKGAEIVYALPRDRVENKGTYNRVVKLFLSGLSRFNYIDAPSAISSARLFSRTVLNFILKATDRHRILAVAPALSGFSYAQVIYDRKDPAGEIGHIQARRQALPKAFNLIFAVSPRPLRLVTYLTLGISFLTIFYSIYVVGFWLLSPEVAPGWTSISLQISGLFFLFSLVLAVMSEYLQQVLEGIERRPLYYVSKRSFSETMSFAKDLNVLRNDDNETARPAIEIAATATSPNDKERASE